MKQVVRCGVCGKEYGSWFDFVNHFFEEHSEKFIESGFAKVEYNEPLKGNILKKVRARYNIAEFDFEPIPGDMVRVVIKSVRLMGLDVLKEVVCSIEEFMEAVGGKVVGVSFGSDERGVYIIVKVDVGVSSWNEFVKKIIG